MVCFISVLARYSVHAQLKVIYPTLILAKRPRSAGILHPGSAGLIDPGTQAPRVGHDVFFEETTSIALRYIDAEYEWSIGIPNLKSLGLLASLLYQNI